MAKVWDKPITAETDWGGDASTDNLPVSGRQVQAWIKSNIKSDAQISQLLVSWLNTHTINSPVFWKGLPIDADTLSWDGDKLTVIGSDGESQPIDEQFLINFLQENGYLTKGDYPFVYDAEKKAWLFTGDLVATGAITMFGDFNKFKPSTIMDAVQVDDITIGKTAEGVLYAKSGGGSGGSGMSYEEINQIVSNAIQNKADKATTLEGYGIENAYDKSYIDTLAYKLTTIYNWGDHSKAGYVFKDTKQDISARHNFTNGIEIGGLAAYKSKDDVVFLDANLVVRGAITMYGDNGTTSKTIWENIPFDSTMQWNGSTWSVVGGGGSSINEDAVNLLIGEYLTNNNYASEQWVSNQGYAKQSSLDGVDNRLKSVETFFATSDTDNLVNKWDEIVTFLNATEGDTLDNILKTKANQSALDDAVASLTTEIGKKWTQNDAKIANWDSAYGWGNHANAGYAAKTYVDGELAKYVKLATAQTISARHNFSDGLQIGGITIRKSQDGVVYIDGNLVIKGAMTMFGTDATIPSSIWASIPFDSTMKWDGSKWSVVGGGSGSVDDAKVNVLISEYLAKNSYATQLWVQNQGYLTTHQSISHLLSKTDAANTYQPIINSSNKLAYSLISGTPDLSVYFRSSNFTKANIKSTLGISDWALAATKPSYTAAEVGALAISGGSVSSDDYQPLIVNSNFSSGIEDVRIAISHNWNVKGLFNWESNGVGLRMYNTTCGSAIGIKDDGTPYYDSYGLIHSGNIGSYNAGSANRLRAIVADEGRGNLNNILEGGGIVYNYNNLGYWENAPYGASYGSCAQFTSERGNYSYLAGQLFWDINHASTTDTTRNLWWRAADINRWTNSKWHQIAFTDSNVASATKLATPRTIWGQSFDGTADISGTIKNVDVIRNARSNWIIGEASLDGEVHIGSTSFAQARTLYNANGMLSLLANGTFRLLRREDTPPLMHSILTYEAAPYGLLTRINTDGSVSLQAQREANDDECFRLLLNPLGGNVAIGGTTADAKLHVYGDVKIGCNVDNYLKIETDSQKWWIGVGAESSDDKFVIYNHTNKLYPFIIDTYGKVGVNVRTTDTLSQGLSVAGGIDIYELNSQYTGVIGLNRKSAVGGLYNPSYAGWQIHNRAGWFEIFVEPTSGSTKTALSIGSNGNTTINGDLLATGAITMFSQLSMKNVIDYDGLSLAQLEQIKPARFTWKDGRDSLVHVGGIADEVMSILPEVIYQTSDNKLTMDYGSAAFYVGASLIKPVVELWEAKDNHEKRIAELERENKRKDEVIAILQNMLNQLRA